MTPNPLRILLALTVPVVLAVIMAGLIPSPAPTPGDLADVDLRPVPAGSAEALARRFEDAGYGWPPEEPVPPLSVQSFPADLAQLPSDEKKSLFFRSLLPLVAAENRELEKTRRKVKSMFAGTAPPPDSEEFETLERLALRYRLDASPADPGFANALLKRIDRVPAALALAQAANESAWGTSRFAREGLNLFGQWTWDAKKGLVPRQRREGATHFVRRFNSLRESVAAYMHNLNSHPAYSEFRNIRAAQRKAGQPLDAIALAGGLERYSERGQAYVAEIRAMIRHNELARLRTVTLEAG